MCHPTDARPPLAPISGGSIDAGAVSLHASDGAEPAGYLARAADPGGAGIVIIPDVRGLHPFYLELARQFAGAGVHALALDLYARTAGPGQREDGFDWPPHVAATTQPTIAADVRAAADLLRSDSGGLADRVFTVGFCFGGRASFLQAVEDHGLAGVIGFYGAPGGPNRAGLPEPIQLAADFRCAVLGLFGGADDGIPPEMVAGFDAALDAAGVDHELVTYPGAPHSFFDRSAAEHADAAADAWNRVLAFVGVA